MPTVMTWAEVQALMRFYSVSSLQELIEAQAHHVEKLQAKLPPLKDEQPGRVREGGRAR